MQAILHPNRSTSACSVWRGNTVAVKRPSAWRAMPVNSPIPMAPTYARIVKETATVWKAPSPAICATRTTITTPLLPPRISVFAVPLRAPHVPLTVRKRVALFRIVVVWHPRHTNLSFFLFVFLRRLYARDALSGNKLLACHKNWPRDLRVPD